MTNKEFLLDKINKCSNTELSSILTHDMEPLEKLCGIKLPCWGNESQFNFWLNSNYRDK